MKKVFNKIDQTTQKIVKGRQNLTKYNKQIHQGYWKITELVTHYFEELGIYNGLTLEQNEEQLNKTYQQKLQNIHNNIKNKQKLLTELHPQIKQILQYFQKNKIIHQGQIKVEDIVLFLDKVSKPVDQIFLYQYLRFILTVFKSIRESQQTINNQILKFFTQSNVFSLKIIKKSNLLQIQQKIKIDQNIIQKISKKITKNRKNLLKKKRVLKKQQLNEQQMGEQNVKNQQVNEKQEIISKFNKLFKDVKNVLQTFIFHKEDRNKFLSQQKMKTYYFDLIMRRERQFPNHSKQI